MLRALAVLAAMLAVPATAAAQDGDVRTCPLETPIQFASVQPDDQGERVRIAFDSDAPVLVDVFQQSRRQRLLRGHLVARFKARRNGFVWSGRGNRRRVRDGFLVVRLRARRGNGRYEVRRFALRRSGGRYGARPRYELVPRCDLLTTARLSRPVISRR